MARKKQSVDRGIYGKLFFSMTVSIVATILILSTILYLNFEKIVQDQTFSQTMERLEQTTREASAMSVTASTFAKQIYRDQHIAKLLELPDVSPEEVKTAISQLNNYRETSPFIDSIYVFNAQAGTFFVSASMSTLAVYAEREFYDDEMVGMVQQISRYEPFMPLPRQIPMDRLSSSIGEKFRDVYSFVLYDTLAKEEKRDVVVVNIKGGQLHRKIDDDPIHSEDNTFIVDGSGKLVSSGWSYPMLHNLSASPYIARILDKADKPGYFVEEVEGVKSLVTHSARDYLGWQYVRIVSYDSITARIDDMKKKTALTAMIILLLGLGFSYLVSRKLFHGLNKKLSDLRVLEIERRDSLQSLRNGWVRHLLLGWEKSDAGHVRKQFQKLHIDMAADQTFRALLFRIDRYRSFVEEYDNEDRKLFRYAIGNIVQEIMAPHFRVFAADMGEDGVAALIHPGEPYPDSEEAVLAGLIKQVQEAVTAYLKLTVTASYSLPDRIDSVQRLFEQALEASYYRLFRGRESIIDYRSVELGKQKTYHYPRNKEKQLIEELMLGKRDEVRRIFGEIIHEAAQCSLESFQLALSGVTFELNNAIQTLKPYAGTGGESDLPSLPAFLYDQVETIDELEERYFAAFDTLVQRMEQKKRGKYDDLTRSIANMIEERYMDPNLSLEMIADELNLSAAYIGRIFKQHTLKTILGYITEVRMNKVRQLLVDSKDSIGEIAEKTGFSNSPYFYKAFKKLNGVTPAEFRKHGKASESESNAAT